MYHHYVTLYIQIIQRRRFKYNTVKKKCHVPKPVPVCLQVKVKVKFTLEQATKAQKRE